MLALLVATWLVLQLFASVLLPFVAAAGIAYVLDPPTTQLARLGLPRGVAALLMLLALIAAVLLFALLLYPLILAQVGILFSRVPQYVAALQGWANQEIVRLQQSFGSDVVNDKLRDLVSSQAGSMLSFIAGALSRLIGGGFALFNVLTLMVVTPVVAFYLLRDWPRLIAMIDAWLPRRYAEVIRAQVREVDRILSAWVRGQALCCLLLAAYYIMALTLAGLDLGLIVGLAAGLLSFLSPCVLPLVPPYLTFIAGVTLEDLSSESRSKARRDIFLASLFFVFGFGTVFTALGATASFFGQALRANMEILSYAAGAIIIAMRKKDGTFDTTPEPDVRIDPGDVLVCVGTAEELRNNELIKTYYLGQD